MLCIIGAHWALHGGYSAAHDMDHGCFMRAPWALKACTVGARWAINKASRRSLRGAHDMPRGRSLGYRGYHSPYWGYVGGS